MAKRNKGKSKNKSKRKNKTVNKSTFPAIGAEDYPLTKDEEALIRRLKNRNNTLYESTLWNYFNNGTDFINLYDTSYGEDTVGIIAHKAEMSKFTLYKCIQLAKEFIEDDIELFCTGGAFVLAHKWIKEFISLGKEAIIENFKESSTLNEFKEKMKALKKQSKGGNPKKDDVPSNLCPGENSQDQAGQNPTENEPEEPQGSDSKELQNSEVTGKVDTESEASNASAETDGGGDGTTESGDQDDDPDGEGSEPEGLDGGITGKTNPEEKGAPATAKTVKPKKQANKKTPQEIAELKRKAGSTHQNPKPANSPSTMEERLFQDSSSREKKTYESPTIFDKRKLENLQLENRRLREENEELKNQNIDLTEIVEKLSKLIDHNIDNIQDFEERVAA